MRRRASLPRESTMSQSTQIVHVRSVLPINITYRHYGRLTEILQSFENYESNFCKQLIHGFIITGPSSLQLALVQVQVLVLDLSDSTPLRFGLITFFGRDSVHV